MPRSMLSLAVGFSLKLLFSLQFGSLLALAFAQAMRNRRSSWYQRGLVREPLREIGVVLLYDVEHGFPAELAMVLGKISMHVGKLFVGHGNQASAAIPGLYRNLLTIIPQLIDFSLVWFPKARPRWGAAVRKSAGHRPFVNRSLTIPA
jgi:hypothetical protein